MINLVLLFISLGNVELFYFKEIFIIFRYKNMDK